MSKFNFIVFFSLLLLSSCATKDLYKESQDDFIKPLYDIADLIKAVTIPQESVDSTHIKKKLCFNKSYIISDFYSQDSCLSKKTDSVFAQLSEREKIGQMFIVAYETPVNQSKSILKKIESKSIGGILLLRGSSSDFKSKIELFKQKNNGLPLLFSADAELSLINQKISGLEKITNANKIKSINDLISETQKINKILTEIGIHQNFAPSSDQSKNRAIISNRSFSKVDDSIVKYSNQFIKTTQNDNIIATAKHFPGHGLVKGDSHKETVFIDGEMKELDNFKQILPHSISVMVGHISIKNNQFSTENLPSTCSRKIVTELLRDSLKYKGLIVTDAMNMMAATKVKNAEIKAILAGCDMIVMPVNHISAIEELEKKITQNKPLKMQIEESVKRIIRLKICLNLL